MGFLGKAMAAAEQAAARAKEGVEDVQLKRELGQAYGELGREAFALVEGGEISHPQLEAAVVKIRELNAKAALSDDTPSDEASAEDGPHDSDVPPVTPV